MTRDELAKKLDGCLYGAEITRELEREAKDNGLVVIFGASDDLVELRGVINDELDAYNGTTFNITKTHVLGDFEQLKEDYESTEEDFKKYFDGKANSKEIEVIWNDSAELTWEYKTDIPHSIFNVFEEDSSSGEIFCKGIVISVNDI